VTDTPAPQGLPRAQEGRMVFEEIIRHSPRRRALPWIAEGFSPTASAVERIIAVLRYVEPCPGLPCCTRRPLLERSIVVRLRLKPWLRSGKPCGLDQPRSPWLWQGYLKRQPRRGFHALREGLSPHERGHARRRTTSDCFSCRPKFISVAVWGARA